MQTTQTTPKLLTVNQFVQLYSVSRSTLYRLLSAGELKSRKVGSRTYIATQDADDWINNLPSGVTEKAVSEF